MEMNEIIFGGQSFGYWISHCLLFLFGVFFVYLIKTQNRKHKDIPLNKDYWWADNWRKLVFVIMLMYLCVRGFDEVYSYFKDVAVINYDLSQAIATILLGACNQWILNILGKRIPGIVHREDPKTFIAKKGK